MASKLEIYTPLESPTSFRLLTLEPASRRNDSIRCSLNVTTIDTPLKFYALSYVWGEPKFVHSICCNEIEVRVTENLLKALKAIRSSTKAVTVWVDALCIDQANTLERNHQVQHMVDIYQRATKVLVWLGDDHYGEVKEVFNMVSKLVSEDLRIRSKSFVSAKDGLPRKTLEAWKRLSVLPWFSRMWTTQEIGLASSAVMICGRAQIAWERLAEAYKWMDKHIPQAELERHQFDPGGVAFLYKSFSVDHGSFLELLDKTRRRAASDPRDRVFALLGHPVARRPGTSEPIVAVDYTRSLSSIYQETAEAVIKRTQNLEVLSYTTNKSPEIRLNEGGLGHATWVPEWHASVYAQRLWTPSCKFNACGRFTHGMPNLPFYNLFVSRALCLQGIFLSRITQISDRLRKEDVLERSTRDGERSELTKMWEKIDSIRFRTGDSLLDFSEWQALLSGGSVNGKTNYGGRSAFSTWWDALESDPSPSTEEMHDADRRRRKEIRNMDRIQDLVWSVCNGRRIFVSQSGHIGLGPYPMELADEVWIFPDAKVPFIFRKHGKQFTLVGECYVAMMMNGQIEPLVDRGHRSWEAIHIV